MAVRVRQPFSREKNLGKAYNEEMRLLPDGDHGCLRDYDTLILSHNTIPLIEDYVAQYPGALLTCFTNRISNLNRTQLYLGHVEESANLYYHLDIAEKLEKEPMSVTEINDDISGFLMVVPKDVWQRFPFPETGRCLGIDTYYGRKIRRHGVKILRMDTIYVFHTYRMRQGIHVKTHLL